MLGLRITLTPTQRPRTVSGSLISSCSVTNLKDHPTCLLRIHPPLIHRLRIHRRHGELACVAGADPVLELLHAAADIAVEQHAVLARFDVFGDEAAAR